MEVHEDQLDFYYYVSLRNIPFEAPLPVLGMRLMPNYDTAKPTSALQLLKNSGYIVVGHKLQVFKEKFLETKFGFVTFFLRKEEARNDDNEESKKVENTDSSNSNNPGIDPSFQSLPLQLHELFLKWATVEMPEALREVSGNDPNVSLAEIKVILPPSSGSSSGAERPHNNDHDETIGEREEKKLAAGEQEEPSSSSEPHTQLLQSLSDKPFSAISYLQSWERTPGVASFKADPPKIMTFFMSLLEEKKKKKNDSDDDAEMNEGAATSTPPEALMSYNSNRVIVNPVLRPGSLGPKQLVWLRANHPAFPNPATSETMSMFWREGLSGVNVTIAE